MSRADAPGRAFRRSAGLCALALLSTSLLLGSCATGSAGGAVHGQAAGDDSFDTWIARADGALEGGDVREALDALAEARRVEPDHPELLFHFGRAYEQAGAHGAAYLAVAGYVTGGGTPAREQRSRASLQALSELASAPLTALLNDLVEESKPKEAIGFIHLVQRYDADFPVMQEDFRGASCEFLSLLAAAAFEEEQMKDAEVISRHALALTKRCPLAFAIAARSAVMRGDRDAAERLFSDGLAHNPAVLLFHRDLAAFYREDGDYERAILHLQAYLAEDIEDEEREALEAMLVDTERHARFAKVLERLTGSPEMPRSSGTGFVITKDGYALTAAHVVNEASRVRVVDASGQLHPGEVVFVDDESDVALVRLGGEWRPLPLAQGPAALGTEVFTVGYPDILVLGISPKLASGVVSSTAGPLDAPHLLQISVPIQPGNSGGPVVDERGDVVGLVVGRMLPGSYENVAYAVGVERVQKLIEGRQELASTKLAKRRGKPAKNTRARAGSSVVLVLAW